MIGRLRGFATEEGDGTVLVMAGGVGYEVMAPLGTLGRAQKTKDGEVLLWVYTHVREDALMLFGFADEAARSIFRALTSVSGIGPKIAIAMLSTLTDEELTSAIGNQDIKLLTAVPGVGKKTAERLILELRDKLGKAVPKSGSASKMVSPTTRTAQVVAALVGMGYKLVEAERAIATIQDPEAKEMQHLLRATLQALAK
jgi:holliday junction DNA helicase RuvA